MKHTRSNKNSKTGKNKTHKNRKIKNTTSRKRMKKQRGGYRGIHRVAVKVVPLRYKTSTGIYPLVSYYNGNKDRNDYTEPTNGDVMKQLLVGLKDVDETLLTMKEGIKGPFPAVQTFEVLINDRK